MLRYLLFLSCTFGTLLIQAEDKKIDPNIIIGEVNGESSDDFSIVNVRLNQAPPWKKLTVEAHGGFLQIGLPLSISPHPGEFYEANSPYLKKIVLYQTGTTNSVLRIFTAKDAALVKEATEAEILGNRVVITVDHRSLKQILAKANVNTEAKAAPILAKTEVAKPEAPVALEVPAALPLTVVPLAPAPSVTAEVVPQALAPTEQVKAEVLSLEEPQGNLEEAAALPAPKAVAKAATVKTRTEPTNEVSDLDKRLEILAYISFAFMMLLLFGLSIARVLRNKKIYQEEAGDAYQMKTISSLSLAPKQRLSLVQVGNEKILLSVSSDQVSLITRIEEPKMVRSQITASAPITSRPVAKNLAQAPQAARLSSSRSEQAHEGASKAELNQLIEKMQEKQTEAKPRATLPNDRKRINYAITDDGIKNQTLTPAKKGNESAQKAIEDVTKLIRDKLKALPKL